MTQILRNIEAGEIQAELARRGIPPGQRLRVVLIEAADATRGEAAARSLLERCAKTTAFAKSQGLTEEKLAELLRDE